MSHGVTVGVMVGVTPGSMDLEIESEPNFICICRLFFMPVFSVCVSDEKVHSFSTVYLKTVECNRRKLSN